MVWKYYPERGDILKKTVILFLLLTFFCGTGYAQVKVGGKNNAYMSTTRGDYPVQYVTFYDYGAKWDPGRYQIDILLEGPVTRYGQDYSLRKHKLALKTPDKLYVAEFTDENTATFFEGSFNRVSFTFRLSPETVAAIQANDDITLVGYYPVGYFEYKLPMTTIQEWRAVINNGPVTYPNPIKF